MMNRKQRYILIAGAIAFIIAIATTPSVIIWQGQLLYEKPSYAPNAHFPHPVIAAIRGISVLVVTGLLCLAFKERKA